MAVEGFRLTAFPRLHLGLIDCGAATARAFGGVGVALDGPRTVLVARGASDFRLSCATRLDRRTLGDAERVIRRFESVAALPKVDLLVDTTPPPHIGLGTKTTLLVAIARSLQEAAQVDLSADELVALTQRGGASGIGVHSFFKGGWIADGGHRRDAARPLLPSSMAGPSVRPPVLFRRPVRGDWRFHLVLPSGVRRSGRSEKAFFKANTPIRTRSVLDTLAVVYHGLLPAIVEDDLSSIREALASLQRTGFKQRELRAQPTAVRRCIRALHGAGFAAGMSSMGPLTFAISERGRTDEVRRIAEDQRARYLGEFSGRNRGAVLEALR